MVTKTKLTQWLQLGLAEQVRGKIHSWENIYLNAGDTKGDDDSVLTGFYVLFWFFAACAKLSAAFFLSSYSWCNCSLTWMKSLLWHWASITVISANNQSAVWINRLRLPHLIIVYCVFVCLIQRHMHKTVEALTSSACFATSPLNHFGA